MKKNFGSVAFTESVKREQESRGSRRAYARMTEEGPDTDRFGPYEREFIAGRDGFYVASVGEQGWPYVQYKGGEKGFLRVVDERTLEYTELEGNRQYITLGNVKEEERVCLFLMDYAEQQRLKIYGRAKLEGRRMVIRLEAFDWNCPQHITPRYTAEEWRMRRSGE